MKKRILDNGLIDLGSVLCNEDIIHTKKNWDDLLEDHRMATKGKWYKLFGYSETIIIIQCDEGYLHHFSRDKFYTEQEIRKMKLKRIQDEESI